MTAPLEVDTEALRRVGGEFTAAGDHLAALRVDGPLGDAAAAIPQLATAAACRAAQATIAVRMETVAQRARGYGSDLASAAANYDATDEASGATIDGVGIPAPQ